MLIIWHKMSLKASVFTTIDDIIGIILFLKNIFSN